MAVEPEGQDAMPCVCSQLRRASRLVSVFYDAALAPVGLTVTQYALLARIGRVGGTSVSVLAAGLGMDRTTLTRNLGPLERDGLVAREAGEDRRERRLQLTAAGKKRAAAARPHWLRAQREFLGAMGAERLGALRALLAEAEGVAGAD